MFKTFNIGQQVFIVDLTENKIIPGVVVGNSLSTTGYKLIEVRVKTKEGFAKMDKECAFVCEELKHAKAALADFLPIQKEMNSIRDKAQAELDAKRKLIIGEPEYAHLVEKSNKVRR